MRRRRRRSINGEILSSRKRNWNANNCVALEIWVIQYFWFAHKGKSQFFRLFGKEKYNTHRDLSKDTHAPFTTNKRKKWSIPTKQIETMHCSTWTRVHLWCVFHLFTHSHEKKKKKRNGEERRDGARVCVSDKSRRDTHFSLTFVILCRLNVVFQLTISQHEHDQCLFNQKWIEKWSLCLANMILHFYFHHLRKMRRNKRRNSKPDFSHQRA